MSDTPEGYSRRAQGTIAPKKGYPRHKDAISPQNRVGQSWKQDRVAVEVPDYGGREYNGFIMVDKGPIKCKKCQRLIELDGLYGRNGKERDPVIRIDSRGYAVCNCCGDVYNDGVVQAIKAKERAKKKATADFRVKCSRKY